MDGLAEVERMLWGDPPDDPRGTLTMVAEVFCGTCDACRILEVGSATMAARVFRKTGWKRTKWDGWICPDCVERIRDRK